MSRREDIDNAIWSDPDFEALSLEATTLYIWSFTNPRCGMAGLYKVSRRAMTESKVPAERLDDTLAELAETGFAFYEEGVLWIRTRARHLRQKTVQIAKSIRSDVDKIPVGHPLVARFLDAYAHAPWLHEQFYDLVPNDAQVTVDRGSPEGREGRPPEPNKERVTRPSGEGQVTLQGNGNGKGNGVEGGSGGSDEPPADFPDELRAVLPKVVAVLVRIATARGANEVSTAAVARSMASYPRRPHLRAAEDLEHWLVYGTGKRNKVRDVVGYFRNQLDRRWEDQARPVALSGATSREIGAALREDRGETPGPAA